MDIGEYCITKNGEVYKVAEHLSGKKKEFHSLDDLMEWIREDITKVEEEEGG